MRKSNKDGNSTVGLLDAVPYSSLVAALDKLLHTINFDFKRKLGRVAIKPNLCFYFTPTAGETTDPRLVEALIDLLRKYNLSEDICIVESDATAMRLDHCFKMLNYELLSTRKGVKLINLSKDTLVQSESTDPFLSQISLPNLLVNDIDYFITMPKLKLHTITGLTCALKNQFGCIPAKRKVVYHEKINKILPYVNKILSPDLVIVDSLICQGKTPKKLNLLMAGYDPVAVDFVAAKIAGLNPKRIKHITESEKMGVGSTEVKILGDDLNHFAKAFPRKGFIYANSRKAMVGLYGYYVKNFTLEGKLLKSNKKIGA